MGARCRGGVCQDRAEFSLWCHNFVTCFVAKGRNDAENGIIKRSARRLSAAL